MTHEQKTVAIGAASGALSMMVAIACISLISSDIRDNSDAVRALSRTATR